jgi:hypothetical protein
MRRPSAGEIRVRVLVAAARTALTLAVLASASCAAPDNFGSVVSKAEAPAVPYPTLALASVPRQANFRDATPSTNARLVANWVADSDDNGSLPFAVIDKTGAKVFIFDASARLRGATFALMGLARGDDSAPGIGSARLSAITPAERTTPAGRFVGQLGVDAGQSVFWVDYADSIAMHPVVVGSPGDHRFARLATASALDKRITFGCINVPKKFYYNVVATTFSGTTGIVYVLPDSKTVQDVFPEAEMTGSTAQAALQIR